MICNAMEKQRFKIESKYDIIELYKNKLSIILLILGLILSDDNKILTISIFLFSIAKHNGVILMLCY